MMKVADMKKLEEDADKELAELMKGQETPPADTATPAPVTDTSQPAKPAEAPGTGLSTPPGEVQPPITPAPIPEEGLEFWKEEARKAHERYAALQGKYMAETAPLAAKIKELQELLTGKDTEIEGLKTKLAAAPAVNAPPSNGVTAPAVNPAIEKMREEHGDAFADTMLELIKPFEAANAELRKSVETLGTQLEEAKKAKPAAPAAAPTPEAESPIEKFFRNLTMMVPDWPEINKNPEWLKFLGTQNPASGRPWQEELDYHHGKGNVGGDGTSFGVADVFKKFKSQSAPAPEIPAAKPSGQLKGLEEHIDPSTVGGTPPGTQPQPKTFTRAEVNQFNDDVIKGRAQKHLTAAEIQKRLDEYDTADAEGRVR
jgi:hypothetical protein